LKRIARSNDQRVLRRPPEPAVLISQNRMARQTEKRSHLDLQVSMLSEQELTTALQMLQKLCQHMGVDVKSATQEVQGFSKTTDMHKLATELEERLPEQ
jgi:uncharacterized membrane protein